MAEIRPPRPFDRILVIVSGGSECTICAPKSRPRHFTLDRFRTGNRSRNFAYLATSIADFEGRQMFSELPPHCLAAGQQYRAGTRHRGERSTESNPHTIQFIRPPPHPPSSDLRLPVSADDCTSLSAKRPGPLWNPQRHTAGIILKTSVAKFREYLPRLPR